MYEKYELENNPKFSFLDKFHLATMKNIFHLCKIAHFPSITNLFFTFWKLASIFKLL